MCVFVLCKLNARIGFQCPIATYPHAQLCPAQRVSSVSCVLASAAVRCPVLSPVHSAVLGGVLPVYTRRVALVDASSSGPTRGANTTARLLPPSKPSNASTLVDAHWISADGDRVGHHSADGRAEDTASDAALRPVPATNATLGKKQLGPCCDDFDCGPDVIDCDKELDCSVATCPLDPRRPGVGARLMSINGVDVDEDDCNNRAPYGQMCSCTCRCVCMGYPGGEIVWLEWPILD